MRRVAGAAILVVLLGSGHVTRWLAVHDDRPRAFVPPTAPAESTPPAPRPQPSIASLDDPLRFLSTAPAESLDLLPSIGPVLAGRLVAAREREGAFTTWDQVDRVPGIGPKTIARLQALVRPK
jgi:competence protein ComEA